MAEDFVAELFRQLGYTVARNVRLQGVEIDLVIERNGQRSPVEVSTRASLGKIRTDAARLSAIMESPEAIQNPILVILG
jgi:Holliday junction resolvase-like predicted endonuclease